MAEAGGVVDHPLLRPAETVRKVAYVVVTGDRGLAGAYNSNVIRAAEREVQARRTEGQDYSLVVCGKKGVNYFRFRGYRSEEHTSELQSLMRISYAVFCLTKQKQQTTAND